MLGAVRRAKAGEGDVLDGWTLVDEGSRADGDNNALRRDLLAAHPALEADAGIELRFDIICARDGTASLRIWQRPRAPRVRRKPRLASTS